MVLLNGPVQNAWFCLMDRYRNVCVWFMARNCRFPKVGTLCCQRGNHRLPLQATAGSQRLELTLPNLGTTGYHCKELPVPRGWNSWFPTWEPQVTIARNCRFPEVGTLGSQLGNHGLPSQATVKMIWKHFRYNFMVLLNGPVQNAWFCLMDRYRNVCVWFMARNCRFPKVGTLCCQRGNHRLPLQGTAGSQRMELLVPWEPEVTIASNCRFPKVGTLCCQRGNHRLPLQGTAGSQRMELLVLVQFPTWEPEVTIASNCPFLEVGTHASHRLPLQGTSGSQRLELSVANVGTTGYHCKELPFLRGWNSWFPTWEPEVTIASNCRFPKVGTLCCQRVNHRLPLQGTAGS